MRRVSLPAIVTLFALFILLVNCPTAPRPYDIVIKNGFIIDGAGNPWFKADIAVRGDRIAAIGQVDTSRASRLIDAEGLHVTPGFIDVHTHCDRGTVERPTVDNYVMQGVTTVIGGNCGDHPYPLEDLFQKIEAEGLSVNFGCLVGHNTIRSEVMGYRMEAPSPAEMTEMKRLIDQEMRAGGLGFSTGLSYLPGIYSNTEELVSLASAVAPYSGIYTTHLRDQGLRISEAISEAITVGEKNGIPVQVSHIKLAQDDVWGELERITRPVEEARERGVEVWLDQYPYTATSSGFTSSLPSWAFEGGREKFLERLEDREAYQKIKSYVIKRRLSSSKDIDKLETIFISSCRQNPEYQGKNLREILLSQGKEPSTSNGADLIIDIERQGGASGVFFQMDEKDVEDLMKLSYNMFASDGGIQEPDRGVPHPRNYGTFPRVISHYVREKGVLHLEEAIRKMTSLPAQVFRLKNRGLLREGMCADITIFDCRRFQDKATYSQPHQYSQGLVWVLVNGEVVVENNAHKGRRSGQVLYGFGKAHGRGR